jgi:hypothetical protein
MFLKDDLYTGTGSTKLYHCWTDKVTKFDSSSFYNWEQDNMPVYDLDERTHYLWEQLGFPTSSIAGVMLVVSSTASDSDIVCNKNVFRSVSSAIAALPQTINFPIIIEVASFGDLGNLILNNFKFGPKGSLEIINRNFSKGDAEVSGNLNFNNGGNQKLFVNYGNADSSVFNPHSYLSSVALTSTIESAGAGVGSTFSVRGGFLQASALSLSCSIFSSLTDTRLTSNLNGFISLYKNNTNKFSRGSLVEDDQNSRSPFNSTSSTIDFTTYDLNPLASDGVHTYDASTLDLLTNNTLYLNSFEANSPVRGLFFGNKLFKVVINNCEGPIYLRNFFLDGGGINLSNNNYGIEINNSTNIYLENTVVTRYRKAGLIFNNSNVNLLRGCVATRIYDFDSTNRLTGPWSIKSKYILANDGTQVSNEDSGAGLISNNSIITVSSTRVIEESLQQSNVLSRHGSYFNSFYPFINANYIFDFSKNSNGIILNNSVLQGGDKYYSDISNHYKYQINFDIYNNVGYGIKSINSKISFDGRLNIFENLNGILLDSSVFEIDKATLVYNQKIAVESNNSNIIYNKNLVNYGSYERPYRPLMFSGNGQHLVLNNSNMNPVFTSGMDSIYEEIIFDRPIGRLNSTLKQIIPSVEIKNNSKAVLVSPYMKRDSNHSTIAAAAACKGSEISVLNNSKLNIKGTKNYATRVFGPQGRVFQSNIAAIYAGNKSTIEINGPTVIAQYGIDLLAESNSTISMNPHKSIDNRSIDLSSFNLLDSGNHTAVELHSTRACVVIDDHSTFDVKDLGSCKTSWTRSNIYSSLILSGLDYSDQIEILDPYVSAGSLQFYPNPIGSYNNALGTFPGIDTLASLTSEKFTANSNPGLHYLKSPSVTSVFDYSAVTAGGYCVRALNNSLVNIHNVNFPCGWWQTSAPYYDNTIGINSGGYCSKLFIWNIADTSQLKASYLSVSGLYPRTAGYYGPSGLWASGGSTRVASGMPSSTPDTSSVSILDYFGAAATNLNPFGKTTAQNYGPFRLYFSVDPVVYALTEAASSVSGFGYIPQIYSQGYQPVSALVCNSDVSNIYSVALQRNSSNIIAPSGYYYGSSIMSNNGFIRISLDESAAETFANAKHCSVGKSGNAKLTSIHYPYTSKFGSSYGALGIKSVNLFDIERDN